MAIPVFILGESGTGKSASLRNFTKDQVGVIQAVKKPLPFRNDFKYLNSEGGEMGATDNFETIKKYMHGFTKSMSKSAVVIDDFQYVMANEFMHRSGEKGFDKFTEIAKHAWEIIRFAQDLDCDSRIYFLSHIQTNDFGESRAKTIGKLLDEKITLEGLFTVVLKTTVRDGRYCFETRNDGKSTVKSPMGLFEEDLIDNDLAAVDSQIKDYYHLEK